jgi:hypothetical protein
MEAAEVQTKVVNPNENQRLRRCCGAHPNVRAGDGRQRAAMVAQAVTKLVDLNRLVWRPYVRAAQRNVDVRA